MDRGITYPGSIPLDTDILSVNRNALIAVGYLAQATLGTATYADGLACLPTLPASMQITVGPGSLTSMSTIDASAYGSIAADLNPLVKTGVNPFGSTIFTISAPGISGQSINYLIEAQLVEADGSPISLPYYNAANPSQPFTGPNNSQAQQNTVRTQRVGLQLKAGSPAATGTQQTPGVDVGWVGLYTVTCNFAQTSITSTSIAVYPSAPFIGAKIPNLAPLFSPGFTGTPTAPTPPAGDVSTRIATTASMIAFGHAPTQAVFTSSGSWVVPTGVTRAKFTVTGGGGGAAGNGNSQSGGGGGAGGTGIGTFAVSGTVSITIGTGGSGGAGFSGSNGAASGATGSGILITANGGSGGNNAGAGAFSGGFGGSATGATINVSGGDGAEGGPSNITSVGGQGGASFWGGGGRAGTGATGTAGGGEAYGSGGGGGYGSSVINGGPGRAGIVLIEF